jgi:hypothetical protein
MKGSEETTAMIGNARVVATYVTGEGSMGKCTGYAPSHLAIARLAYQLYERRGREDGHDVRDWLRAEALLERRPPPVEAA